MIHHLYEWTPASEIRNELSFCYEPIQPYLLVELAKILEKFVFLDVGANIGLYSILVGSLENCEKVVSFEPNKHCLPEIHANIALNGLIEKIQTHELALSDRKGDAEFLITSALSGASGMAVSRPFSKLGTHAVTVRTDILDSVCSAFTVAVVIKIDVEGHEMHVLKGAKRILSDHFGILQLEILPDGRQEEKINDLLESFGWKLFFRIHNDYYYHKLSSELESDFFIAVIQRALSNLVETNTRGIGPSRRRMFGGITIEIPRKVARRIRQFLGQR